MKHLHKTLSANAPAHPGDVLAAKHFLKFQGFYAPPKWGITPFPDRALFDAVKSFQKVQGLKVDGVMKPQGETERAIKAEVQKLQSMGRNGDTILAHITPAEAMMLKENGGAGTINPKTGLLEFYDVGKSGKGKDQYIWRTVSDGKVRSSHAERDGKTFSWDNPPDGGHPGEAYNCRCTAEDIVDTKKRCEELTRLIKGMEINLNKAEERWTKAAEKSNAALKALNQREKKCGEKLNEALLNIAKKGGAGGLAGLSKGGWPGAAIGTIRGAGSAAILKSRGVYDACIENVTNSQVKMNYEKAKQELKSAKFWVKAHREDLKGYRDEYEQTGCEI